MDLKRCAVKDVLKMETGAALRASHLNEKMKLVLFMPLTLFPEAASSAGSHPSSDQSYVGRTSDHRAN